LRDFKKYTNAAIIRDIDLINESRKEWLIRAFGKSASGLNRIRNYKVWRDGNHPIQLESNVFIQEKIDYIRANPVVSEIVEEPEYYLYSSSRDYSGQKGLLKVEILE